MDSNGFHKNRTPQPKFQYAESTLIPYGNPTEHRAGPTWPLHSKQAKDSQPVMPLSGGGYRIGPVLANAKNQGFCLVSFIELVVQDLSAYH